MVTYLSDAIAACEAALNNPSDLILACQTLGNVLQSMGRFDDAIYWHTQALQAQPNLTDIYTSLGNLYTEQQHWEKAIALYEKALTLKPDTPNIYLSMGEVFSKWGMQPEALDAWYQALILEPTQATADAHCDLGNLLFRQGNLEQAAICYQNALQLKPDSSEAHHNLGEAWQHLERWDDAIACYRAATERDPNPAWAYHKLGDMLVKHDRVDEAIAAYRQSIQHNPDFPWSRHNLVEALLRQEQWEDAIAVSHATLALNNTLPWAYTHLGRAQVKTGQIVEAIASNQKACGLQGWHQCIENDYQFTQDWFSHNIPNWEKYLQPVAHMPALNILEIGSFQGMSACWLLDNMLTHPSARLTCIDPDFQPQFEPNISKTGALEKVIQLTGASHDILTSLISHSYDVIYIDGCHLADYVQQDGLLSWNLLKVGGFMIFDDYQWSDPNYPGQDPKLGIDRFLDIVQDPIEILHRNYQVILRKVVA